MDEQYWDRTAEVYEDSILNVFVHDRRRLIRSRVRQHMPAAALAGDFGCGIGFGIPILASVADKVFAMDLSGSNLDRARSRYRRHSNVNYLQCDLASAAPNVPRLHFALVVNCLISPDEKTRSAIIGNVARSMRVGGTVVFVVPSMESTLWVYKRLYDLELRKRKGKSHAMKNVNRIIRQETDSIPEGILSMDGVRTKFFLGPELDECLRENGFALQQREKLEYGWDAEIENPPTWLGAPRPWHWLTVATRTRKRRRR